MGKLMVDFGSLGLWLWDERDLVPAQQPQPGLAVIPD